MELRPLGEALGTEARGIDLMIVMTGSMVPIRYPAAGDRVLVEISGLGTAELVLR